MVEKNELIKKEEAYLENYGGILDFKEMFNNAIELFSEQATKAKNSTSIAQLELTKAKVNSFNDSIENITTLSHTLEIMGADKDRFKRKDELSILNNLREQCEIQSRIGLANMGIVQQKLVDLMKENDVDVDALATLQGVLDANIDSAQKVIMSVSRLIQLERYSGNRPWGKSSSSQLNIGYIKTLDEENESEGGSAIKGKKRPTRRITPEDLASAGGKIAYED